MQTDIFPPTIEHFFTSDLHLGHKGVVRHCYDTRGHFMTDADRAAYALNSKHKICDESMNAHDLQIIKNINDTVPEYNSVLWILGDFSLCTDRVVLRDYRNRIRCSTVHLVYGNHDHTPAYSETDRPIFHSYNDSAMLLIDPNTGAYCTHKQVMEWSLFEKQIRKLAKSKDTIRIHLSHYAMASWLWRAQGSIHLYGHSHGKFEGWRERHMIDFKCFDVGVDCHNLFPISLEQVFFQTTYNNTTSCQHSSSCSPSLSS